MQQVLHVLLVILLRVLIILYTPLPDLRQSTTSSNPALNFGCLECECEHAHMNLRQRSKRQDRVTNDTGIYPQLHCLIIGSHGNLSPRRAVARCKADGFLHGVGKDLVKQWLNKMRTKLIKKFVVFLRKLTVIKS